MNNKNSTSIIAMTEPVSEGKISALDIASDALHEVNMILASIIPRDPGFNAIEQKRDELDARFKRLVREAFADNTAIFVEAGSNLNKVNAKMKKDIQSLENLQKVIDSITKVIKALDTFIATVFPLPV
jgi:hypothetical protein